MFYLSRRELTTNLFACILTICVRFRCRVSLCEIRIILELKRKRFALRLTASNLATIKCSPEADILTASCCGSSQI